MLLSILIALLSLWPGGTDGLGSSDKLAHAVAYGTLTASGFVAWNDGRHRFAAMIFAIALGVALEVAQSFVPGRVASGTDAAANTVGCLIVVLVVAGWQRWRVSGYRHSGNRR